MESKIEIDGTAVYRYVFHPIDSNMYIMIKNGEALVVDPHVNAKADALLEKSGIHKICILLTHEHFDHISGVNHFRERWDCTVICSEAARERLPEPDKNLSAYCDVLLMDKVKEGTDFDKAYSCYGDTGFEGEYEMEWNGWHIRMVHTPGHSKGSICIVINESYIFTGDSLVDGNSIITRLPGGSKEEYLAVTKPFLEGLGKDMLVFPGHGKEHPLSCFEIV